MKVRLDSPNTVVWAEVPDDYDGDFLVHNDQVFVRDTAQYKRWGDPTTFSKVDTPIAQIGHYVRV